MLNLWLLSMPVAVLEFLPAAARARIIAASLGEQILPLLILIGVQPHQFGRRTILP
jgi:hypothetical protein